MVREFLIKNGLRQKDLANYLGVTEGAVSQLVKGKTRLSQRHLNRLLGNNEGWDVSMLEAQGQSEFSRRLAQFAKASGLSIRSLEKNLNVGNGWVSDARVKVDIDKVSEISRQYPELNLQWLFTGDGDMVNVNTSNARRIPILPFSAVAGWLDGNNSSPSDEYMSVPDFSDRHADYVIRVSGDSMSPKYNGGDLLAIRRLVSPSFFQWGKVYVLNTTQGCIIKRLFPDPKDENNVICHSENNEKYPDYKIAKEEILGVAIVVGYVGLE